MYIFQQLIKINYSNKLHDFGIENCILFEYNIDSQVNYNAYR